MLGWCDRIRKNGRGKKMVAMVGAAAIASLVTALPADGITFCLATSLAHRVREL